MSGAGNRRARLRALFDEASELPAAARPDFVRARCGLDEALAEELTALLEAGAGAEPDVAGVVSGAAARALDSMAAGEAPRRIGPYRVVGLIGHGGMGTVYLAEREEFHQRVAIKLLRGVAASADVITRFRAEREILANLNHPGIARLYDGGTTDGGLPYFVMEFIDGENIVEYCRSRDLPVDERLALFRRVCDAVQYAHRNLIIHRDIKPGNIMVDEDGRPKLLDFGIAKLVRPELARHTVAATVADARLMTPEHASPEQLRGEPVTTATDIYALGLLLYEILTGRRPFRTADTRTAAELERLICETEPARPSAVAATSGLRRRLAGDLDNIVLTALRKEPERRYPAVAQLSEDVQRARDLKPVLARPDTLGYRLGRFAARNRAGLAVTAAVLLIVIGLIGFYTVRLSAERDRALLAESQARTEAATARRVSDFLTGLFRLPDPRESRGETVTAREILDRGAAQIREDLADEPLVQGRLMRTMGGVYEQLGLYEPSRKLLEEAVARHENSFPESGVELAESLLALSSVYYSEGRYAEARRVGERSLAVRETLSATHVPEYAASLDQLGTVAYYQDDFLASEDYYRRAADLLRELVGEEDPRYARVLDHLGLTLQTLGRYEDSERFALEALAIRESAFGEVHPSTATSLLNVATLYLNLGRDAEAEPLLLRALAVDRETNGPDHPDVAWDLRTLASLYERQGRYEEAEAAAGEALEIWRRAVGDSHVQVVISLDSLAGVRLAAGRATEAEATAREALAIARAELGDDHSYTAYGHYTLGRALSAQARYGDAAAHLETALRIRRDTEGATSGNTLESMVALADAYAGAGRHEDALALYEEWATGKERQLGPGPELAAVLRRQAAALADAGEGERAAAARARATVMAE
jgi:tetratricopeptide (TPR) repeat protein